MEGVAGSVLELVGNTPLVRLRRVVPEKCAQVLAKLESLNPGGSVKDRLAQAMVEDGEATGGLPPGCTIVEATSGNAGVSLAMVAAARGYRLVIFMPEHTALERRRLLERYGAEVRLTPADLGMEGCHRAAEALVGSNRGCVSLDMFQNPAVVRVHRESTAVEILQATQGKVDAFVAGRGYGGDPYGRG